MRILSLMLLLVALCATGCANKGLTGSFYGDMPQNDVPAQIAGDAVDYIAALYPPGHTTVQILSADKKSDNPFASAFEGMLRRMGFTVLPATELPAEPDNCLSIAYTLDVLEEGAAYYLVLRFSDGKAVSRAYTATGKPEAGRSATPHEFKRPILQRMEQGTRRAYESAVSSVDSL